MASDENIPPVSSLRSKFEKLAATSSVTTESQNASRRKPARVRSNSTELKPERPSERYLDPKRIVSGPHDPSSPSTQSLRLSPSYPELKLSSDAKPMPPSRGSRTPSPQPPFPTNGSSSPNNNNSTQLKAAALTQNSVEEPAPGGIPLPKLKLEEHSSEQMNIARSQQTASLPPPALPARPRLSGTSPLLRPRPFSAAVTSADFDVPASNIRLNGHASRSPTDTASDETIPFTKRPPPIPPRQSDPLDHRRSSSESTSSNSEHSSHRSNVSHGNRPALSIPPPLPQRRSGSDDVVEKPPQFPRRRSSSPPTIPVATRPRLSDIPPPPSRVISAVMGGLPPPPLRSLATKVPPLKTPQQHQRRSSDDSSSVSEEETPSRSSSKTNITRPLYDELPDSTHCSRRLPLAPASIFRSSVSVPLGSVAAVAGNHVVVTSGNDIKLYDMTRGVLSGTATLDLREIGLEWKKENRITSMEFRAGSENSEENGRHLWCGTKDGHIFEFDIVEQIMTRVRYNIHSHAITTILRHGRTMITIDDSGKVSIWKDYIDLGGATPRVIRISEKQGFIRLFNGLLWTSNGTGSGIGSSNSSNRGPSIRVYDILSSTISNKVLIPSDILGAVTSGTILPSRPERVYLGHEGGYISIWTVGGKESFDSGQSVPTCVHTLKITSSDILALEGVVDKLWSGSRNGVINTYDVDTKTPDQADVSEDVKKPWRLTNSWQAYSEFPVSRIFVDPYSIAKAQALHVVSIARGGQLRFWDGLLGTDWIEGELQKRETEFSAFRPLNVLICSWNTDAQKPETLHGSSANVSFLSDVLSSVERPDIIAFGFQELIDLENRGLTAKTVLLGGQKKNADGSISDKVSRSYRLWHDALVHAVRLAMPADDPYVVVHTDNLVGLFSCIFVRQRQKALLRDSAIKIFKRGLGGRYGNKGAIVARFVFDDSSICFINCHLAAGQSHTRARNRDIAAILEDASALPRSDVPNFLPYAGGGDGSMILDHEICFLHGDLNYRIDLRRDAIINSIQNNDFKTISHHDQLHKQIKSNPSFRLRSFVEPNITFAPTYKYDRRSDTYDSSEKKRAPAWCDRILWHCRDSSRIRNLHYRRYEVDVSDHRPISAGYSVTVKKIDNDAREGIKVEVQQHWKDRELNILINMQHKQPLDSLSSWPVVQMKRLSSIVITNPLINTVKRLKYYPPKKSQVSSRPCGKPRLSFTPIIPKTVKPWAFHLLLNVQRMLTKGKNEEAVKFCLQEMIRFKNRLPNERRDCYHRVISLFTKVGDFNSAISLCNAMQEEGYEISTQTCMVLFRNMVTHDVQHIRQLRALLAFGGVDKMDDFAFKTILDSMLLHRDPPKMIEKAFRIYAHTRGSDWVPPRAMFGIIIQTFALAGRFRMSQYWLDKYRVTYQQYKSDDQSFKNHSQRLTLEEKIDLKLRLRYRLKPGSDAACYPYTAVLMGYNQSPIPLPDRLEWLFGRMKADGVDADLDMCKILIPLFIRWGWPERAFILYESMLCSENFPHPDRIIFQELFMSTNPARQQGQGQGSHKKARPPTQGLTSRQLLKDMLALHRMKGGVPRGNLVSTSTFNCAIGTFVAQQDYAAAWTVLAFFTRYHVTPDRYTVKNVVLGLLRRMRNEALDTKRRNDILWIDRFLGAPRDVSFAVQAKDRRLLGDHLFALGRFIFAEQLHERHRTYLAPTSAIKNDAQEDMLFLVGLLRTALQAELGFSRTTERQNEAAIAIKNEMQVALGDMFPLGKRGPSGRETFIPRWLKGGGKSSM
ncbi:hypothetical protein Clacol_002066 [Clathrus columnatus]|uniref:Inositol polyphosphate-related phosphatase domain-containing protein n=1 Tax=Clathrus columnatus TaxID=1419009 RepID=A0AAV5A0S8_9AGAM|nr:hypothetical protein Clacol_002066 [Clathrus columnatus]